MKEATAAVTMKFGEGADDDYGFDGMGRAKHTGIHKIKNTQSTHKLGLSKR